MSKVTEIPFVSHAMVPCRDEMVMPSRSTIHWPELFTKRVSYGSRTELETYVPVTCGNCKINRSIRVLRGLSADLLSANSLSSEKGKVFTGICRVCTHLLREYAHKNDATEDETLPSRSIIHWTERGRSRGVPVTCGRCGKRRFIVCPNPKAITGFCDHCGRRKHVSDEHLSSGSIIHWGEPDPINASLVMVTCGGCGCKRMTHPTETGMCLRCAGATRRTDNDEELTSGSIIHWKERGDHRKKAMVTCGQCGKNRMVWIPRGKERHGPFVGFCPRCARKARMKNPHMKDGRDETLPSGSTIHWGEWDQKNPKRAPVTCFVCGNKRMTTIQTRKGWTGICFEHRSAAAIIQAVTAVTQNGNGQKNRSAVRKKSGPEKGQYAFITLANMEQAFKNVDGFPTKAKVAKALGVSESGIDKWLVRESEDWRQIQQRFIKTY